MRNLAETQLILHVEILIHSLIENHDADCYNFGAFNDDIEKALIIEVTEATEDTSNMGSACLVCMLTMLIYDYDLSLLIEVTAFYFFMPTCNHSLKINVV